MPPRDARVADVAAYLKDKALFRSLFWTVGWLTVWAIKTLTMLNLQKVKGRNRRFIRAQ
jgi:hypothetical protein